MKVWTEVVFEKEKCQETLKQVGIFEEEDNTKQGPIIEKVR